MPSNPTIEGIEICEANRATIYVRGSKDSDGYKDLLKWLAWYNSRGMHAVLVVTTNGWAVYRNNLVTIDIHND